MAPKNVSVYFRDRIWEVIGKNDGLSRRLSAMLARFERLCQELMPEFTRAEWSAIMDANNGGTDLWLGEGLEDHASGTMIWANVHDSIGLGEKWEIDQKSLVKRLQKLSAAELLAVDEAISRFWNHSELEPDAALQAAWCKIAEVK